MLCNFIEIALRDECFPVNLLHIFKTPFPKNTSGRLLLGKRFRRVQSLPGFMRKIIFRGNVDLRKNFLESFNVCLCLPENCLCFLCQNLAISGVGPILNGSEDSI